MLIYVDNDGPNVVSAAVLVLVVFGGSSRDWQLGGFRHTLSGTLLAVLQLVGELIRKVYWYRDSEAGLGEGIFSYRCPSVAF